MNRVRTEQSWKRFLCLQEYAEFVDQRPDEGGINAQCLITLIHQYKSELRITIFTPGEIYS